MEKDLVESLARALRPDSPQREHDQSVALFRDVLELYSPSNLAELYMAVRAKVAGNGGGYESVIEALLIAADREPHLAIDRFAERAAG